MTMKMFAKLFDFVVRFYYFLFDRFIFYPLLRMLRTKFNVRFLNLGYWPHEGEEPPLLVPNKLFKRNDAVAAHIYLYEKTLSLHPAYPTLKGLRILEVSCGHAGGLKWIQIAHPEIESVRGIDRVVVDSEDGIVCEGDASSLPFEDNSFDLVLNVESSHLYASQERFFHECARVLRPNGYLCWADLRYAHLMSEVLATARGAQLALLSFNDITAQVLEGIERTSARYDSFVAQAPWFVRLFSGTIRSTYCAPGTFTYRRLEMGEKKYACACWQNAK